MKLKFDKSGRRFFFLTFCVRGRRPILSKLVTGHDENGKLTASVILTELGEKIAALWRGVHARHPALDPTLGWTAIGDLTILASPFMFPVRLTRKMTVEQHQPEIARFDPTAEDSRYLAEGRQLFLSSFPVDVPVFPVNYDNCHLMNARNEALCARANGQVICAKNAHIPKG